MCKYLICVIIVVSSIIIRPVNAQGILPIKILDYGASSFIEVSPDNKFIAVVPKEDAKSSKTGNSIEILDAKTYDVLVRFGDENTAIRDIEWHPTMRYIASLDVNYEVRIWDALSGKKISELLIDKTFNERDEYFFALTSISWDNEGKRIAIGNDYYVTIWDIENDISLTFDRGEDYGVVVGVAWSYDNKYLVSVENTGTISLYDAEDLQLIKEFKRMPSNKSRCYDTEVNYAYMVFNNSIIYTINNKHSTDTHLICFWEYETGNLYGEINTSSALTSSALSPDNKLALSYEDGSIQIWDLDKLKLLLEIEAHTDVVSSVAWYNNSNNLLSGSLDGTIKVWEISE